MQKKKEISGALTDVTKCAWHYPANQKVAS